MKNLKILYLFAIIAIISVSLPVSAQNKFYSLGDVSCDCVKINYLRCYVYSDGDIELSGYYSSRNGCKEPFTLKFYDMDGNLLFKLFFENIGLRSTGKLKVFNGYTIYEVSEEYFKSSGYNDKITNNYDKIWSVTFDFGIDKSKKEYNNDEEYYDDEYDDEAGEPNYDQYRD